MLIVLYSFQIVKSNKLYPLSSYSTTINHNRTMFPTLSPSYYPTMHP